MILNVLVFPAGTEVGLEIHSALKDCKEVVLFGAGDSFVSHASYVFKNFSILPLITSENFIDLLNKYCSSNRIDYIFPAYDDVVLFLSENKDKIYSKIIAPDSNICNICRFKSKTYSFLNGVVPTPRIFSVSRQMPFPVFIKPDKGQGSQNAQKILNYEELIKINNINDYIVTEYLPGEEYTIDCFSDLNHELLYSGPRIRNRMRNGIAVNSEPSNINNIQDIASKISLELKMVGAWFFQMKKDTSGDLKLLEVAPRIAGSMSVNRMFGVNFSLLTLYLYEGYNVNILKNNYSFSIDRALKNVYRHDISYDVVYLDFDDTVFVKNILNPKAIYFIVQSINFGRKVVLISRHNGDLIYKLKELRIDSLFDEVYHLKDNELKSDFISNKNSVFIDDSFAERSDVHSKLGIPVFDVDMIDMLIDFRS